KDHGKHQHVEPRTQASRDLVQMLVQMQEQIDEVFEIFHGRQGHFLREIADERSHAAGENTFSRVATALPASIELTCTGNSEEREWKYGGELPDKAQRAGAAPSPIW